MPLHEESIPFTAGDGLALTLRRVRSRSQPPRRGPVLLVHGAGVRANIFRPPLPTTFVDALVAAGYDVWLENWRASIEVPRNEWTLDQAALHDHPAAVQKVLDVSGARSVKAVIHCQGSTSFAMSAVAGLLPQVDTIVSNAVSLHPIVSSIAHLKSALAVPLVGALTRYLDPQWGEHPSGLVPQLLNALVRLTHHECDNGVCKFSSFTYGFGFPVLWRHENLDAATHDWIRHEFGPVPLSFFRQMARCLDAGHLVAAQSLPGLPGDFAAAAPRTTARFAFVAGAQNNCFHWRSQQASFDWFERHRPGLQSLHVIEGYGHLDVFLGRQAARDTYPVLLAALEN